MATVLVAIFDMELKSKIINCTDMHVGQKFYDDLKEFCISKFPKLIWPHYIQTNCDFIHKFPFRWIILMAILDVFVWFIFGFESS